MVLRQMMGPSLETGAVLDSATDQGSPEVLEKTALPFGLVFLALAGVNRRSRICIFQHHCTDLRRLSVDAIYDSLRENSRFQDVLHRMKFPG
jgi:hypothetical protein